MSLPGSTGARGISLVEVVVALLLLELIVCASTESVRSTLSGYGQLQQTISETIPADVVRRLIEEKLPALDAGPAGEVTAAIEPPLRSAGYTCAEESAVTDQHYNYFLCSRAGSETPNHEQKRLNLRREK